MRLLTVVALVMLAGCASLPRPGADYPKQSSSALVKSSQTRFAQALTREAIDNTGASAFRLLPIGADGLITRVELADGAERSLDVQYFIFRNDQAGRLVADALLRAADRGVRVRILLDDGETVAGDENIELLDAHPNVEVRVFNPFAYRGHTKLLRSVEFLLNRDRLDYRMHNKLLIADNAVALIGGRNVANEYFQIDPRRQFADDDLFSSGPVVQELSKKFDDYWNSDLAIPVAGLSGGRPSAQQLAAYREQMQDIRDRPLPNGRNYGPQISSGQPLADILSGKLPVTWATWKVVCDSPDKKKVEQGWRVGHLMERPVADAASSVQTELLMVTPYLIPGDEGMRLIDNLRARDVAVRLLTNSLETSTVAAAQAGYMHYRLPLIDRGVDLFEIRARLGDSRGSGQTEDISQYGNYSLHGKMFVFDRRKVFIGSMNFDERSMHLNTEIGLIIDSESLAHQVATRFEAMAAPENAYHVELASKHPPRLSWHTVEQGRHADLETEPARNPWQRLQVDTLTLLPLDKEL